MPTPWPNEWFKESGVCVRKSDGCIPGTKAKTCQDPDDPKWADKYVCSHTPNEPRKPDCPWMTAEDKEFAKEDFEGYKKSNTTNVKKLEKKLEEKLDKILEKKRKKTK